MRDMAFGVFFYIAFCLIQFFWGQYINIAGIFPNFILIATVYLGISKGIIYAEVMGFLFGLAWDVFSCDAFCIRAIMFTIIGYLSGEIYGNFNKEKIFSQFIIMFITSIIYWFGLGLFYFILLDKWSYLYSFFGLMGILKIVSTILLAPAVFWVLDCIRRRT